MVSYGLYIYIYVYICLYYDFWLCFVNMLTLHGCHGGE